MSMLEHASAEAKRLGLGFDMATGTGWPFGGPNVAPEDAIHRIVRSGDGLSGSPTGMKVKRAAPGGEGLVLDPYSTAALDRYLRTFTHAFEGFTRDRVRAQFHDSFEYYDASWTARLPQVFREQHGYDIEAYAAQLLSEAPSEPDTLSRLKSDYRETLGRMHIEYVRRWVSWSHDHGFLARNQSHGAPANLLDLYGLVDIPETESFGSTAFSIPGLRRDPQDVRADLTPPHPLMHRMASSAAHVMGKRLTSSESGTWVREHWKESPAVLKPQLDQLFVAGVNHILYHGTVYTPPDQPWPGWYFYASTQLSVTNPLWREFAELNTYVTRVQSILQSGEPDNDVLVYWPFADVIDHPDGLMRQYQVENARHWLLDSSAGRLALELDRHGYAFDFISDDQLLATKFERGELHTPGNRYRAIVVPSTRRMPVATLSHLRELAAQGAEVLLQSMPVDVPGLANLDARRAQFKSLTESDELRRAIVQSEVVQSLEQRDVAREPMVELGLRYVRREQSTGHDYFIANLGASRVEGWVALGRPALHAMLLDPTSGRAGWAATRKGKRARTELYLQLEPGESMLVRTHAAKTQKRIQEWSYLQPKDNAIALEGEWAVEFIAGGPELPVSTTARGLTSWTELGDLATARFAGTARYRIEFDAPRTSADVWMLDLGDVREAARVRLNGQDLGAAWSLPFRVRVDGRLQPRNVLEIEVTNLAANRIRDMDRRKVPWRLMKDIDIVNVHYRPFDASQWGIAPSGLLGPVSLTPMRSIRP